jgi:hypothetical protein
LASTYANKVAKIALKDVEVDMNDEMMDYRFTDLAITYPWFYDSVMRDKLRSVPAKQLYDIWGALESNNGNHMGFAHLIPDIVQDRNTAISILIDIRSELEDELQQMANSRPKHKTTYFINQMTEPAKEEYYREFNADVREYKSNIDRIEADITDINQIIESV